MVRPGSRKETFLVKALYSILVTRDASLSHDASFGDLVHPKTWASSHGRQHRGKP